MTEQTKLSPQAQQMLIQLQTFQQQIQTIAFQKETLGIQDIELGKALDDLKKAKDDEEVFKAVGPILIKSNKKDLEKELSEKKESIEE